MVVKNPLTQNALVATKTLPELTTWLDLQPKEVRSVAVMAAVMAMNTAAKMFDDAIEEELRESNWQAK